MSAEGKDIQNESFVSALCGWRLSLEEISNIVPRVNRGIRFGGVATQKGEVIEGGYQNEIEPL
jgi:hypothetical protein